VESNQDQGVIYIIATPIGNLSDISERALQTLAKVDVIAAEDTRYSKRLLGHYNIQTRLISLHDFNEKHKTETILTRVLAGELLALISDAGTPLISDPGYHLVAKARQMGIQVTPIPGACAAIAALSVAGLPSDRFVFEGFLPAQSSARRARLQELAQEMRTIIFYEAPHRIKATLSDLQTVFGNERYAVLARELTKIHETIYGASLAQLNIWLNADPRQQKGELVIMVNGANILAQEQEDVTLSVETILTELMQELPIKQAVELTTKITKRRKNAIYQMALAIEK
jgi:16S rRNA (cytidine1402-2'-O)-methyltransferase